MLLNKDVGNYTIEMQCNYIIILQYLSYKASLVYPRKPSLAYGINML